MEILTKSHGQASYGMLLHEDRVYITNVYQEPGQTWNVLQSVILRANRGDWRGWSADNNRIAFVLGAVDAELLAQPVSDNVVRGIN